MSFGEMPSKTILTFHSTPIRMAKTQNINDTKCWRGCEAIRTLIRCWVGMQNGKASLEDSGAVSYKTKHPLTSPEITQSRNCVPLVSIQRSGKLISTPKLATQICYGSFVHKHLTLETIKMSFKKWWFTQTMN